MTTRGTQIASMTTKGLLALACASFMGCVVTNKIDFQVPANTPPSIYVPESTALPGEPIDRIIRLDLDDPTNPSVTLRFTVRDPDVSQSLEGQLFVDYDRQNDTLGDTRAFTVPPTGAATRDVVYVVPPSALSQPGCHKIEILVSGQFKNEGRRRTPVEDGDLAQTVWLAEVVDATNPVVEMSSCPE